MEGLIEPYLLKAINLLHSSAKDSGDQLKVMLDEAIRLKNESGSSSSKLPLPPPLTNMIKKDVKMLKKNDIFSEEEDVPLSRRRKESSPHSSLSSSPSLSMMEKNKETKRKFGDIFSESDEASSKKFKDSPRSSLPASPLAANSPHQHHSRSTSPSGARKSDDLDSLIDADDLAQDLMDLNCVVCNGLDVSPGNQLVECTDCHNLYHQECHRPSISDAEVNDPRSVFLCSDCNKLLKKSASLPRPKSSSPITFKSRSDSPGLTGKPSLAAGFKQTTIPSIANKSSAKSSASSSSSSSTSSSSGSNSNVNTSIMSADRRLQNMKKKATTKFQEKRKPGK